MAEQTFHALAHTALNEMRSVLDNVSIDEIDQLSRTIGDSRCIVLYGVGREGLMMKGLAMRLYHLGLNAHVLGDMTTPPLGSGDLFIASAGPGYFSSVAALCQTAHDAGARVACITAMPDANLPKSADLTLTLPAQTMASDQEQTQSVLPMGSLYEGTQYLAFELLILNLRGQLAESVESMRARHTNME